MAGGVDDQLAAYRAGEVGKARAGLRALIDSDASLDAYRGLGGLELAEVCEAEARAMLGVLAASEDPSGPQAAAALVMLDDPVIGAPVLAGLAKEMTGDLEAAGAIYMAIAENDPVRGPLAKAFLADLLSRTETDVDELLAVLMDAAESDDRLARAYACLIAAPVLLELEGFELAGSALWRAVDGDGHPAMLPWAAVLLGEICIASGDLGRARAAFDLAISTGHPGLARRSYVGQFQVLARQDDRSALRELHRRAAEDGRADAVPGYVHWMLGEQSVLAGDLPEALTLLQRIPESDEGFGHTAIAVGSVISGAYEAVRTGLLRLRASDTDAHRQASRLCFQVVLRLEAHSGTDACRSVLEVLIDAGDSDTVARAYFLLGKLRSAVGDRAGALDAWERGAVTGHPVMARSSATGRGVLLAAQGDQVGARAAFGNGVDYPLAMTIADDLREAGDVDAAVVAYSLVMDGDDPAEGLRAAQNVGRIRYTQGDQRGIVDAVVAEHRHAVATGNPELIADATCRLGDSHREQGDLAAAREAYEYVIEHGAGPAASWATLGLGIIAAQSGDGQTARRHLLRVVDAHHAGTGLVAAMTLGHLAKQQRDLAQAEKWYQRVIGSGDAQEVPLALAHLGELCYWLGLPVEASTHYQQVLDSTQERELVAEAAYRLGEMTADEGDTTRAAELLTVARDTGDPDFAPQASSMLARLRTSPPA